MNPRQILIFPLAIALVICAEPNRRNLQRLVGGHLKAPTDQSSTNDAELLDAHSSGSKTKEDRGGVDEEKKTLSQQVADGKYGLIQKELFKKPLKQPGIISYDANPEVPKDNINNLGGLSKEDIWLAENHLLVIKGGTYPKHTDKFDSNPLTWPAIDNYTAPKRPVKIPSHPKVPPPFPVQLTDDGPLQILGTNTTRTLDGPPSIYALPPPEGGYVPGMGPFFPQHPDQADPVARRAPNENPPKAQGEGQGGQPFPPPLNGTSPPSFAHLPPGAVAVPPPSINDFDEDDPSIYYPPPYSFSYPSKDNSSSVPAGPLVPGIILPPPPDFFAPQEETTTKKATPKRPVYTKRPKVQKTTQQSPHVHPTTTPIPPTSVINITLRKPIKVLPNNPTEINNELNTTPIPKPSQRTTTRPPKTKIKTPRPNLKRPSVTILKPVKPAQSHRTFYNQAPPSGDPFPIYGPPRTTTRPKTIVSSTQVPLNHYYSTQEDISNNAVTVVPEKSTVQPANYYFYEEEPHTNSVTPPRSQKIVHDFFNLPDRYYEAPRKAPQQRTKYVYVTSKPFNDPRPRYNLVRQKGRPTSFDAHLEKLREQIEYFSSPRPAFREIQSPRPVYQYSFQASNYKPTHPNNFRPSQPDSPTDDEEGFKPMPRYSVQIQQALEISTNQPTPYPPQNPIYFRQSFRATTVRPLDHQTYYTTAKPKYTYNQLRAKNVIRAKPSVQYSSEAGQNNHDYRGFYIKPEDNYYEGNKANNFGQRIPSHTTAVPEVRYSTRSPKVVYVTNTQRQPKPISLEGDTLVNYINPRPNINPDSELIPVEAPQRAKYPSNYGRRPPDPYNTNYNGRPQIVEAIPISVPNEDARRGSFISYSLPGNNGAHFYFLTPQLAQSRDQGADFYYSQRDSERIRRNDRDGSER